MLSRTANSIYWMSRYLERADNVARFLAVNDHLVLDMGMDRAKAQWSPLVSASGDDDDFVERYGDPTEENVVHFLTFDDRNPNSILSCVQNARENARTLREVISSEMWETLNALYHFVLKQSRKHDGEDFQDFFSEVRTANHHFTGLIENTMSHNQGWYFASIGRLLERADKTARILDVKYFALLPNPDYLDSPYDTVEWGAVLKSVSGFEMYRKQFHRANYRDVAHFLVLDPHFPRAIRYCVNSASEALERIVSMLNVSVPVQGEMAKLRAMVDDADIDLILNSGLHEFIDVFQFNLNVVDESLYRSFFAIEQGQSQSQ